MTDVATNDVVDQIRERVPDATVTAVPCGDEYPNHIEVVLTGHKSGEPLCMYIPFDFMPEARALGIVAHLEEQWAKGPPTTLAA